MGYKRKKQMKKIKSNMAESEAWNFHESVVNNSVLAPSCLLPNPNPYIDSNQFSAFISEQNQYEMNSASALVVPTTSASKLPFTMSPMEQSTFHSMHKKIEALLSFDNIQIQTSRQTHHQSDPYTVGQEVAHCCSCSSAPNISYNDTELVRIFPSPSSSREVNILACASNSNSCCINTITKPNHCNKLAPIGVFWDIENMHIPKGKSGLVAVQVIREKFFAEYQEAEFVCVCDITKESSVVIQELNDAQVNVLHVNANSKNAADDKLRQSMRRFADIYSQMDYSEAANPPTIVLISGDINFSTDLSDFRFRKRLQVILLHNKHAPEALLLCANKHYDFYEVLGDLPARPVGQVDEESQVAPLKGGHTHIDLIVSKLPSSKPMLKVKTRLKKLSDNSGGRVVSIQGNYAVIRFPNKESAQRATKRMNGEDVFGSKILVTYSSQMNMLEFDKNLDELTPNIPQVSANNGNFVSKTQKSSPNGTSGSGTESEGAVIYNGKKYVPKKSISKSVPHSPVAVLNSSPTPSTSSSHHSKIVDPLIASTREKLENLEIQNQQKKKLSAPCGGDQKKKHKQKQKLIPVPLSLSTPASPRANGIKFFKINSTSCTENPNGESTDKKKNLIDHWNSQFKPSSVFNYFANRSSSSPYFASNNDDPTDEPNGSSSATETSIQSAYSHLWKK